MTRSSDLDPSANMPETDRFVITTSRCPWALALGKDRKRGDEGRVARSGRERWERKTTKRENCDKGDSEP